MLTKISGYSGEHLVPGVLAGLSLCSGIGGVELGVECTHGIRYCNYGSFPSSSGETIVYTWWTRRITILDG